MAFMKPTAAYFEPWEAIEYTLDEEDATEFNAIHAPDDPQRLCLAGWYGYLSANGYMDRTDYLGPFDSYDAAVKAVMDLYEVDENGDEPQE